MNKENLIKMAQFILTIPQEKFDMHVWRGVENDLSTPECNTIGCVIGHCTILDPNIDDYINPLSEHIMFLDWSEAFTGLDSNSLVWDYMFAGEWGDYDNTPKGAHDRIMNVVNGLNVTSEHLPWMR